MRLLIVTSLIVLVCGVSQGEEQLVREISWSQLRDSGQALASEVRPGEPLTPGTWWTNRTAGWIGGIAGSIVGCLGALIGTLAGLGKARRLVVSLCVALIVFGVACLVAGVIAWLVSQPYAVYYPLLLGGVICTAVMGGNLPGIRRRYQQRELEKMTAMDVGNT